MQAYDAKNRRENNINSVISEEFYFYNNMMTTYCNCHNTINNVQPIIIQYFPLEKVRKSKGNQQNSVSINDCFEYNQMEGISNDYYCNHYRQFTIYKNKTQIVSALKR